MDGVTAIKIDSKLVKSPNLCDKFTDEDLAAIGGYLYDAFQVDLESRAQWERRTEAAMDLAMQLQKNKTFPWANCSNVNFPLVTIAALQFHARAYPAIINGRSVVQCRVIGKDPQGIAKNRALLIGEHMSYQCLEQDEAWEEGMDRALLNVPIVGCGFKKSRYDASLGHNVSDFVPAKDLVVNYFAPSVEKAQLKTHYVPMFENEIIESVRRGTFRDVLDQGWFTGGASAAEPHDPRGDERKGLQPPADGELAPFMMLECHCWLDLDDDGYAEPYVVTLEQSTQTVVRIVTRFDRIEDVEYNDNKEIVKITPMEYFTKLPFIPSPDGGIYDIGFGTLLGPLNESVNSAINQLFDAGTLANTAGGFLGRGAKLKGGVYSFKPFDWQRVDASGDDLRKSIFPLPVREPSAVMFNLLSLIIEYTNRISGATDMVVGENPGQNTPAETSRTMMEQGQKIYSAIFKRTWRSMKQEFKKLFILNSIYLEDETTFGEGQVIRREDYAMGGMNVCPVADPTITSDIARFARAQILKEAAMNNPGYDVDAVEKLFLQAMGVDNVDEIYPGTKNMPPSEDVKVTIQKMKNEETAMRLEQEKMFFVLTMQETVRLNTAKIAELEAKAAAMQIQAQTIPQKQAIEAFRAAIEAIREGNAHMNAQLDREMEDVRKSRTQRASAVIPSLEEPSSDGSTLPVPV